eukprot:TRINITY_DN3544_c0_g1_i1.p1 TRINITY_DN3544_c0_g1~~TRINITY_DN3544_c0_g1_i1.p1  ORF type:complete len:177 (+),score=32.86 TRINITY_DN3544_c0_g1_i1:30-533(+)
MFSPPVPPDPVGPGQESVWNYPRPPKLERTEHRIRIVFNGVELANSTKAWRLLETSHPPTYYIPAEDIKMEHLRELPGTTFCEFKGYATYYDVQVGDKVARQSAWAYLKPTPGYEGIANCYGFYANKMDECYVGDERATPQPGDYYAGWVTKDIVGPFKGIPGSRFW